MRVVITLEHRFVRGGDGRVWTSPLFGTAFWERYLAVFDEILVAARVDGPSDGIPDASLVPFDVPGVRLLELPSYTGVSGLLRNAPRLVTQLWTAVNTNDALIMRVPSPISLPTTVRCWLRGQPYGLEVIGDPFGVLSRGAYHHPLRPILQRVLRRQMAIQVSRAATVSYVTRKYLQDRYPAGRRTKTFVAPETRTFVYSSLELESSHLVLEVPHVAPRITRIVTVASLEQRYKGVDTIIEAVGLLAQEGIAIQLSVVGDGRYRRSLQDQATTLGIANQVVFLGTLDAKGVNVQLDEADLFVLASRTEGLPRALIEAMGRGLTCIATPVGGIPELLPVECLFGVDDALALAALIKQLSECPTQRARLARQNLVSAGQFESSVLERERSRAYTALRKSTEAWIGRRHS